MGLCAGPLDLTKVRPIEHPDGDWVKATDALAREQAQEQRILELQGQLTVLQDALKEAEAQLTSILESGDWMMPDDTYYQFECARDDMRAQLSALSGSHV
jgi:hypothetical protein